jgi:hypothetical protein
MLKAEIELRGRIRFYAMSHLADECQDLANQVYELSAMVNRPEEMADMPRPTEEILRQRIERNMKLIGVAVNDLRAFNEN